MIAHSSPWMEVDHGAIAWNVGVIRSVLRPGARLLAVVKSNAYETLTSLTARVQRVHRGARSPAVATTAA